MIFRYLKHYWKLYYFRKKWRRKNAHNFTEIKSIFNEAIVSVGNYSYGILDVYTWGNKYEKLNIGSLVSIAVGVKFILGGNHNFDTLSTYPFKVQILNNDTEATTKGPIIIEDDVWIGMDSMILSGVHVGRGAVIAAKSLVVKNVPPYSIVAGNPAKVIKFRFDESKIEKLMKIDFTKIDREFIVKNIDVLYSKLNVETLIQLLNKIR